MTPRSTRERQPARQAALALVARRMLSAAELQTRLARKGYAVSEVDDAVQLLRSYGYIDDAGLAEAVRREADRTGHGPQWIRATLARRGLDEALTEKVCAQAQPGAEALARHLVAVRFGRLEALTAADRRRAFRLLLSRGFSPECAADILGDQG